MQTMCMDGIGLGSHTDIVNVYVYGYGLRTALPKEVEGQMSTVTILPDGSAQSRAFISGRSKVQGMVTYIHK